MTDFTVETRILCADNIRFSTVVGGTAGDLYEVTYGEQNPGEYRYNWHCPCKGFSYRKTCRHIELAKAKRCTAGEDAFSGGSGLSLDDLQANKCPKCGGEVTVIKIAV